MKGIKNVHYEMIHHSDTVPKENTPTTKQLVAAIIYTLLANLHFSEVKGITIQQYINNPQNRESKELLYMMS